MRLHISKRPDAKSGLPSASWDPASLVVMLGDQDITQSLVSLELSVRRDDFVKCALSVTPDEIEVDADVLADLVAIAKHDNDQETA